ncbi:hypothetical protein BaRGS_00016175, partial [Batillaria attramentaria]
DSASPDNAELGNKTPPQVYISLSLPARTSDHSPAPTKQENTVMGGRTHSCRLRGRQALYSLLPPEWKLQDDDEWVRNTSPLSVSLLRRLNVALYCMSRCYWIVLWVFCFEGVLMYGL